MRFSKYLNEENDIIKRRELELDLRYALKKLDILQHKNPSSPEDAADIEEQIETYRQQVSNIRGQLESMNEPEEQENTDSEEESNGDNEE